MKALERSWYLLRKAPQCIQHWMHISLVCFCEMVYPPRTVRMRLVTVFLALVAGPVMAQNCQPGEVRVFVVDSQNGPVLNANVRIASPDGKPFAERLTNTPGGADFQGVPCGSWLVTASKDGFEPASKTFQRPSVQSVTLILNPKMQVSSVDVTDSTPPVEQTASEKSELHPSEVKDLPGNPPTVADTLPLVPGVVRSPDGELKIDGKGEHHSALVVNQTDVTDPATGKFGQTVPIDAIENVNVLNTPFLAQYGRFTAGVVAVETRRGGDKWHAEVNDPFPDFRIRSWHLRGIRNETPRFFFGGPLIRQRVYVHSALQYIYDRPPSRTLPWPYNESTQQLINSFTQVDVIFSPTQLVTATLHVSPQHTNFINPEYFNPQPVTPSYAQHNYIGSAADHFGVFRGLIDSSISVQRFDATVGAQGLADMILTPTGNRGNYFGTQNRSARRLEWLESWSPAPIRVAGTHLLKIGSALTTSGDDGQFTYRPVEILSNDGTLLRRIDFSPRSPFSRTDREVNAYAQDHWAVSPVFAFDYGARIENQRLAESLRIAPRAGIAITPFPNERTVFRTGFGQFYDHIPLDVYTFGRYPDRIITDYAPSGAIVSGPTEYVNVIGTVNGPRSFLVHGEQVAGDFAPRGRTWNAQVEHSFSRLFRIRGVYTDTRSVGLIVFEPQFQGMTNQVVLNGNGASRYRQAEVTGRFTWTDGQQMVFSYTRSRAQGDLNGFDTFLGNFPTPLLHSNVYSNLPGDLPNRFLTWGRVKIPFRGFVLLPIVEYRNGFPYARLNALQTYAGVPNSDSTRFPNFFSADARLMKNFKVNPKYTVRLSVTGFNLTNHFNALAVHSNIADPLSGIFFGNYRRRYRGDFEVIF